MLELIESQAFSDDVAYAEPNYILSTPRSEGALFAETNEILSLIAQSSDSHKQTSAGVGIASVWPELSTGGVSSRSGCFRLRNRPESPCVFR